MTTYIPLAYQADSFVVKSGYGFPVQAFGKGRDPVSLGHEVRVVFVQIVQVIEELVLFHVSHDTLLPVRAHEDRTGIRVLGFTVHKPQRKDK
ncbi:MAG: hypothetical protein L6R30_26645 [Thermoanaerobaculia bacterium]|nr:hypothetical protein [Thermoanaerobaculia bacterium]